MGLISVLGVMLTLLTVILAEGPYVFYGKFRQKCEMGKDGLYYRDERTFVVCSHGNSYVQPCPDGTKNAEYNDFFHGKKYHYNQFCDVNLVDQTITTHAQLHGSYQPPKFPSGNQNAGQNTGATYGANNKQAGLTHRSSGYQSGYNYGAASYGASNQQPKATASGSASGFNTGRSYQRSGTRRRQQQQQQQQQQQPVQHHSGPMTLEETYNTFFNAAGFHARQPFAYNAEYRFRAYPRYN